MQNGSRRQRTRSCVHAGSEWCGGGDAESAPDDGSGEVEGGGILAQDVVGVGGEDDAVEFEGQRVGVFVCGEFVEFERGDDELADEAGEVALECRDLVFDRARAGPIPDRAAKKQPPGNVCRCR